MKAISALIVVFVLAGCGAYAPPTPTPTPAPTVAVAQAPTPRPIPALLLVSANDPRAMGSPDAPVTIYEFTDFECPFCRQFFDETRPQLVEQYVEAGVVRLVARDFPIGQIHPSAMLGALAGRCAAGQQMFWPMYESLFSTHGAEWGGAPSRDREVMLELADRIGLDQEAFRSCMDDPATEQAVLAEVAAAAGLGINSTPNFMINGQIIRGALPFSSFEILIRGVMGSTR